MRCSQENRSSSFAQPGVILDKMPNHHHPKHQHSFLLTSVVFSLLFFTSPCLSKPTNHHHPYHLPLPNHIITQFPNPTWLENIAVRSNGDLLLTESAPTAALHLVSNPNPNPHSPNGSTAKRTTIHTFSSVQALFGITEPVPDLFVIVGGNVSTSTSTSASGPASGPGTPPSDEGSWFFAWSVDFRRAHSTIVGSGNETKPKITQIAHLSKVLLPNGLASIPGDPNVVLVADSFAGLVWRLDILSGEYDIAVQVPEMAAPTTTSNSSNLVGINGIKVYQEYLYWTNSAAVKIYRVKLSQNGYHAGNGTAGVETVADLSSEATFLDDFAIDDDDGVIWVATNSGNKLFAVDTKGKTRKVVLVGGGETELTLAGDTAAAFGEDRKKTLYVTTCGGLRTPINGTVTEGGKVVAVDTSGFWL